MERIETEQGPQHGGEELRESDEQQARRLIQQRVREAGWSDAELGQRAKDDEPKTRMAARLRAEATMTWAWVAQPLARGHWRTAANAVRWLESNLKKGKNHASHSISHL